MATHAVRAGAVAVLAVALLCVPVADAVAAPLPVAGIDPFGWVKDQVLGGLEWGVEQAGGFVTNLLAGIADALIPDWLAEQALELVSWTVSVPDYAAAGEGQGGYAFGGINALRGTLTWVGVTLVPLTLTVAIGRTSLGLGGDHPIAPFTRALGAIALVLVYPYLWSQLASAANRLTATVLAIPAVERGLDDQFEFMVGAGALRGVPMLGAVLLLIAAALLVALLVLKLVILVGGAVLYVTGVLMPGIAATERGQALAQAWVTATVGVIAIPVAWTVIFAVGALLMADAGTAAGAVAGSGKLKELIGGLTLAVGSIAATAVALKVATSIAGVVAGQVSGALALLGRGTQAPGVSGTASGAGAKLAAFGDRVGGALRQTAGDHLPGRARTGALSALAGGGTLLAGGLIGAAGAGGRRALASGARTARRVAQHAPAGTVAARLAQSARTGWTRPGAAPRPGAAGQATQPNGAPPAGSTPHAAAPDPPTSQGDQPATPRPETTGDTPGRAPSPSTGTPPRPSPPPAPEPPPSSARPTQPAPDPPDRPLRDDDTGGPDADVPPTR